MTTPKRPYPETRLLAPGEPLAPGETVWLYEGRLEQFTAPGVSFEYRQRIAWPFEPEWPQVHALGLWMVERLSINGHLLLGLRARPENEPAETARPVRAEG